MNATSAWRRYRRTAAASLCALAAPMLVSSPAAGALPDVAITSPAPGATLSGTVAWNVTASSAVREMRFYIDGQRKMIDSAAPFTYGASGTLDTSALWAGSHTLAVRGYDSAARQISYASRVVYTGAAPQPSSGPLTAALTAPVTGATVSGAVTAKLTASGGTGGIAKVEYWTDGALRATRTTAQSEWTWNTAGLTGAHQVGAVAYDTAGNKVLARNVGVTVTPPTDPGGAGTTTPFWSSGFGGSPWYKEFDGYLPTTWQPQFWPQVDPIGPVDPAAHGVPASPGGGKIMRFPLGSADLASGHRHSKLFKTFNINQSSDGVQGLGGNVSGSYDCNVYWPRGRRIDYSKDAATGLLGWKEIARNRTVQDMTWVASMRPMEWINARPQHQWLGTPPTEKGYPSVFIDHWRSENNSRLVRAMAIPEGRWFKVRAELHDHDRIEWYIDGHHLYTARESQYPVGPQYGRASNDQFVMEIGNYGNALGSTFYDDCSFSRFR